MTRWVGCIAAFFMSGFCVVAADVTTANTSTSPIAPADGATVAGRGEVISNAEATVLELVQDELPQLESVLKRLKSDAPNEYAKAIKELGRSARRLNGIRARDEELYRLELNLFRARTGLSLLVARLKIRDDTKDREALHEAVRELRQAEIAKSQYEVSSIESRIARMQTQLASAQEFLEQRVNSNSHRRIQETVDDYLRKAGRLEKSAK